MKKSELKQLIKEVIISEGKDGQGYRLENIGGG
jgi:hypothetical protein